MRYLKILVLAAMAAVSLLAITGAGTASATELYKLTAPNPNDTLGAGTELEMTTQAGTSTVWKQTHNLGSGTVNTCTSGLTRSRIELAGGGEGVHPSGKVTGMGFSLCASLLGVLKAGVLEIQHVPGTTNGTVISKEAEITVQSPVFGVSCIIKTGAGTKTGTLTGATSNTGFATFHVDAALPYGICGIADLTATFLVTKPTGLIVEAS